MPSVLHELLVELFRYRPQLAFELMDEAVPDAAQLHVGEASLATMRPVAYDADLVVVQRDPDDPRRAVNVLIVEVQLRWDPKKSQAWFAYLVNAHRHYGCPARLVVLTPDARLVEQLARPVGLGHPGLVLKPLVIGPQHVPAITDPERAAAAPELAVLSALAHGSGEQALQVGIAALHAASSLGDDRSRAYGDFVLSSLTDAVRAMLEESMKDYVYRTEFARRIHQKGLDEGRQQGLNEGRQQGLDEGRQQGLDEGRQQGLDVGRQQGILAERRRTLEQLLHHRGLVLDEAHRTRIQTCDDPDRLASWCARAWQALDLEGVFEGH